jgi:integrase
MFFSDRRAKASQKISSDSDFMGLSANNAVILGHFSPSPNVVRIRGGDYGAFDKYVPKVPDELAAFQAWWDALDQRRIIVYYATQASKVTKVLQSVRKVWSSALKKVNLAPFHVYDLRATFASRLSAAGVPDVFVSQMMGHSGGLLQTYSKAIVEYRRDAIRKLEELRQSHPKPSDDQQTATVQQRRTPSTIETMS